MTAYSYNNVMRAWTKECPSCGDTIVGADDEQASLVIFGKHFHIGIQRKGSQDGFQSHCIKCKELNRLARKFGDVNLEELFLIQNGKCAICTEELHLLTKGIGDPYRACVDHDHETGKVRGLLCRGCNSALGRFKDSVDILQRAMDYLKSYQTIVPLVRRA